VKIVSRPDELEPGRRAVAIGTFDGVHLGHRRVIEAALAAGLRPAVVTFHPHPRTILGNRVELLSSVERRLELIADLGVPDVPDFLEQIVAAGGHLWACRMSADMNHFTEDDLRDDVEGIISASDFIEITNGAQLLFI